MKIIRKTFKEKDVTISHPDFAPVVVRSTQIKTADLLESYIAFNGIVDRDKVKVVEEFVFMRYTASIDDFKAISQKEVVEKDENDES